MSEREIEQWDDTDDLALELTEAGYDVAFLHKPTPESQAAAAARLDAQDQAITDLSGTLPKLMGFNPESRERNIAWDERDDKLWLLTPDEFDFIPDGTKLVCINGKTAVKGRDRIDQDTRGGFLAWGLLDSQLADA
jgi:hypothetical protein